MLNPRAAAHEIVSRTHGGAFADHAAEAVLPRVEASERGLALEIAYGCLRLRSRLDRRLETCTDRPLKRIEPPVLDWLRSGAYELTEMRTPAHAAVNETVKQARRAGNGAATGFINAVLRAVARSDSDPFPDRAETLAYLSSYGSHPEWLVRRWLDRWSSHEVGALVEHGNTAPPVVLRVLDAGETDPLAAAASRGIDLERVPGWPRSFRLISGTPVEALSVLSAVIQDPAASAVVDCLDDDIAAPVYDACAAPGTKTASLLARSTGAIVAADLSAGRARRIAGLGARLGRPVQTVVADGRHPPLARAATVLADVPCTGTGVLRRRPDARWRIREEGLRDLVTLQRDILRGCAEIVEDGGILVYSTCSLEAEENEMQVEAFLRSNPAFEREPIDRGRFPEGSVTPAGDLFVTPWMHGADGAYAARLRRAR